jgi:leucine dehydrogenase
MGGSGDPSPMTAYGIYQGMLATAQKLWGSDDLSGATIVLQGLGKVGSYLLPYLKGEGAIIVGTDINPTRVERAQAQFGLKPVRPDEVFSYQCEIFAPCALGGVLNDETVPQLKARAVCGGANNQLLEPRHAEDLAARNILYAPDYIVNAGGVINISYEIGRPYGAEEARRKTGQIYHTLMEVFQQAEAGKTTTLEAANRLAERRIQAVRNIRMPRRAAGPGKP